VSQPAVATSRRNGGFSIIEAMTVVAILAILLGFAIPSYREFLVNNRTTAQANDLLADIAVARTEAVRYARTVRVAANGGDWNTGWVVWVDLDGNGTNDGGEESMRQQPAQSDGFSVAAVDTGGTAVSTLAFGVTGNLTAPASPVEFAVCRPDNDETRSRGVRVELNGRASSKKDISSWTAGC
jgi:type IV fimbrial biogenesis protein FimT